MMEKPKGTDYNKAVDDLLYITSHKVVDAVPCEVPDFPNVVFPSLVVSRTHSEVVHQSGE